MAEPKKIKFGILGCSRVAKKSVLPALIHSELAELTMIGSRSPIVAAELARQFDCPDVGTYEDVLKNPAVDAVYISLPNALHEEWTIKAAQAGKHVWCEKPAALTYAAANRMVSACRASNVRIMEGFMFLFHPQHAAVQKLIADEKFGIPLTFSGQFTYPFPDKGSNRLNKELGGGSLYDAAVYPIRASRMIFNAEPISVSCQLVIEPATGVDIKADLLLTYPDGRSAFVSSAFGGYFQSTYTVLGSKARITATRAYAVPADMSVKIIFEHDDTAEEISIAAVDHFKIMINNFCTEISRGATHTQTYEEDLLAQARILEAGHISFNEQRVVNTSEVKL